MKSGLHTKKTGNAFFDFLKDHLIPCVINKYFLVVFERIKECSQI